MDKTARELSKLIAAIPKNDRGFSWELRDYHGNERLEVYGAIAKAFKYILDNTDAVLSTLKPEGEQISGEAVERVTLDKADQIAKLAHRFWSIHPREIQDMGITREQFYAQEITKLLAGDAVDEEALAKAAREGYAIRCKTHGPRVLEQYASNDIMQRQLDDARVIVKAYLEAAVGGRP